MIRKEQLKTLGATMLIGVTLMTSGCSDTSVNQKVTSSEDDQKTAVVDEISSGQLEDLNYDERKVYFQNQFIEIEEKLSDAKRSDDIDSILEDNYSGAMFYAYVGFADDTFIVFPELDIYEGYKPSERYWYEGAMSAEIYTDEYYDIVEESIIYTISSELDNDNLGKAVFGIDFVLESDSKAAEAYEYEYLAGSVEGDVVDLNRAPVNFLSQKDFDVWVERLVLIEQEIKDFNSDAVIKDVLRKFKENHSELSTVYLASPEGKFYLSDEIEMPEGYDPRNRPWYEKALDTEGAFKSDPYLDAATGFSIISISKELESAPERGWIIGIDIENQ